MCRKIKSFNPARPKEKILPNVIEGDNLSREQQVSIPCIKYIGEGKKTSDAASIGKVGVCPELRNSVATDVYSNSCIDSLLKNEIDKACPKHIHSR